MPEMNGTIAKLGEGCIKTGCNVWLHEYREWIYGDAFIFGALLVFRACSKSLTPNSHVCHITIPTITHWFRRDETSQEHNSTLIAKSFIWHGYGGLIIE